MCKLSRQQACQMVTLPRHALTNIHMHAHADGQPENIMPLAQSVGWTIAQTTETRPEFKSAPKECTAYNR